MNQSFLKKLFPIAVFLLSLAINCLGQEIIPFPNQYKSTGGTLKIPATLSVSATDAEYASLIEVFKTSAEKFCSVKAKKNRSGFIRLIRTSETENREAYKVTISPKGIQVEAGSPVGCFYGLQSLLQLILNAGPERLVDCGVVTDSPRFGWRGMMLDESRHFMDINEVKNLLDMMALHKLNKFHWHLTDAQGWRIEIKKYPLLTSIGAKGNLSNPEAPAAFYTQDQIREIVKYAGERFIEIIPEIDMPGHATSAVKAYPEFSGGGSERYPEFTFHPGKEATYSFLTEILREVATLFPTRYIHIGGDEVSFGSENWNKLTDVKQLMETHHLKNLLEVEHYFLKRMSDSIRVIGKKVIGWDEVVTADLPPDNTAVMWWRHDKPGQLKEALNNGYQVILCPRIPLYFDFVQDASHLHGRKWTGAFAPVETVYRFPEPDLTGGIPIENPLVLGIQANVWTEKIHTPERFQFMTYPRMQALAEAAWTLPQQKDQAGFNSRMGNMMDLFKKWHLAFFNYLKPDSSPEVPGPVK